MHKSLIESNSNADEQDNSFVHEGFIVLKNFLLQNEISNIQKELENVVSCESNSVCFRPNNTLIALKWNDLLVELILKSKYRIEILKRVVKAKDLKWISGYVSIKDPYSPPLWWHQDWWCWQHDISFKKTTSQIALMCYLTSTSKQNGALRVLPGSHHYRTELHASLPEAHGEAANEIKPEHAAMRDYHEQITLNLNAGDAVAIDYRLLHGTHGNSSPFRRDCVMLTFTPSWKELPEDIKGHLISHHALPFSNQFPVQTVFQNDLLPTFEGIRRDLEINRMPPLTFEITE